MSRRFRTFAECPKVDDLKDQAPCLIGGGLLRARSLLRWVNVVRAQRRTRGFLHAPSTCLRPSHGLTFTRDRIDASPVAGLVIAATLSLAHGG